MIAVIPCGKKKRLGRWPAGILYLGCYHRFCLAYAKTLVTEERIFILSAKCGLLALEDQVDSYDLKMGQKGSVTRDRVAEQAKERGVKDEHCLIIAGGKYRTICVSVFKDHQSLLEGLGGIGKQLKWLKEQIHVQT